MTVLDEKYEPILSYNEVYAHGSVCFNYPVIGVDRSTETPFIREVHDYIDSRNVDLSIFGNVNELSVESMIAISLQPMFNTDCILVQRVPPTWPDSDSRIETYVATIGAGHYESHPVSSCKVILRRNS